MGTRSFTSSQIGWLREAALRATPHDRAATRARRRAEQIRRTALAAVLREHAGAYPFTAQVKLGTDGIPLGLEWPDATASPVPEPPIPDPTDAPGTVPAGVEP